MSLFSQRWGMFKTFHKQWNWFFHFQQLSASFHSLQTGKEEKKSIENSLWLWRTTKVKQCRTWFQQKISRAWMRLRSENERMKIDFVNVKKIRKISCKCSPSLLTANCRRTATWWSASPTLNWNLRPQITVMRQWSPISHRRRKGDVKKCSSARQWVNGWMEWYFRVSHANSQLYEVSWAGNKRLRSQRGVFIFFSLCLSQEEDKERLGWLMDLSMFIEGSWKFLTLLLIALSLLHFTLKLQLIAFACLSSLLLLL